MKTHEHVIALIEDAIARMEAEQCFYAQQDAARGLAEHIKANPTALAFVRKGQEQFKVIARDDGRYTRAGHTLHTVVDGLLWTPDAIQRLTIPCLDFRVLEIAENRNSRRVVRLTFADLPRFWRGET